MTSRAVGKTLKVNRQPSYSIVCLAAKLIVPRFVRNQLARLHARSDPRQCFLQVLHRDCRDLVLLYLQNVAAYRDYESS